MAATESKYITLAQNVLLEYVYDEDNLKKDDYQIINNLSTNNKGYCSKQGLNQQSNQLFPIDTIIKKYAIVDQAKYNFLKIANYETTYLHFDRVRIHLPTTYSFSLNDYVGLFLRIYVYDYDKKETVDLASYIYDDTKVGSDKNLVFNQEFLYNEQQYGKYLTFDIPSSYQIARQRTNTNTVQGNTLNSNLALNGIDPETPIFLDFSWVISRQTVLGSEYYYISDINTKSISNKPEYQTLGVTVEESKNGDYFEIYGTYNQTNEYLDDWVDEMVAKGRKIRIEYTISLFEENFLTNQQTVTVVENFTRKILYRPIITFSNTVASIDVQMNVIDLFDNSKIQRISSIGLKENLSKYGKTLARINIDNAFKPKIYNQKVSNRVDGFGINNNIPDINLTKVNFPVIVDRIKILASASPTTTSEYKSMGLAEIIINPFGAILKFDIAADVKGDGTVVPYNLTKITENSTISLSFKDDTNFLEKSIWQQTNNNFEIGEIYFKLVENDLPVLKQIRKNNNNFYLTIDGDKSGMKTLLYSGKFVFYEDVTFLAGSGSGYYDEDGNWVSASNSNDVNGFEVGDFADLGLSKQEIYDLLHGQGNTDTSASETNKNLFIFIHSDSSIDEFENFLSDINADINFKQAGGNSNCLTYMYFILNLSPALITEIKNRPEVMESKEMEFCLGKGKKPTGVINNGDMLNSIAAFNCAGLKN